MSKCTYFALPSCRVESLLSKEPHCKSEAWCLGLNAVFRLSLSLSVSHFLCWSNAQDLCFYCAGAGPCRTETGFKWNCCWVLWRGTAQHPSTLRHSLAQGPVCTCFAFLFLKWHDKIIPPRKRWNIKPRLICLLVCLLILGSSLGWVRA